jgi:hypothetical protein
METLFPLERKKEESVGKETLLLLLCKYMFQYKMYNRVTGKPLERQTNQVCTFKKLWVTCEESP